MVAAEREERWMADGKGTRGAFRDAPLWVHGVALGSFGVIALCLLVLYLVYRDTDVWLLWTGTPLASQHAFAEAVRAGIFRQPANTWSNLGFVFVGLYIMAYAWWDHRREVPADAPYAVRHPALMGHFGLACVVLGFGSGLMHAAMTSLGHRLDVFGMFISVSALVALQLARRVPTLPLGSRRPQSWPVFALAAIVASIVLVLYPDAFGGDITIMVSLIILTGLYVFLDVVLPIAKQQYRWVVLAFGALAIAFYIWNLDVARRFSAPDAWLQGHAIWHLLNAVTLGAMAVYYRTETPRQKALHPER